MKLETDWKLIFVQVFDTLLFELKLLRPAFVLLLALLPTISVFVYRQIVLVHEFQQSSQRKSVKSRTFVGCIPKMFLKVNNRKQESILLHYHLLDLHTKEVIKLITLLFYLFYLLPLIIYLKRKTRNQKPTGSRKASRRKTRRQPS